MAINPDISLQVQTPNAMNTLGSILNVASTGQQIATQKIANESNQKTLNEQNNIRDLMQHPEQFQDQAGNWDWNKFTPALMKAAPTLGPDYIPKVYQGVEAHAKATNALQGMGTQQLTGFGEWLSAHQNDSPDAINAQIDWLAKANPAMAGMADAVHHVIGVAGNDPKAIKTAIGGLLQGVQTSAEQRAMQTQGGPTVSTGQQTQVVNTNPQAASIGTPVPGTTAQQVLPPTTPTFNTEKNAPGYLGPQPVLNGRVAGTDMPGFGGDPQKAAQDIMNSNMPDADKKAALDQLNAQVKSQQNVQSGPALGAEKLIGGTVEEINKDWSNTQESAKTAQTDIGLLQNIKKYASGAVTGVETDRRAYIAGLAGLLHMDSSQLEKTNTDLLAKNTNMLALAGGDTNLARTMAEGANPNTHMTPDAIKDAADQIAAQRRLALEKQKLFGPIKSLVDNQVVDKSVYNSALAKFNQNADPRILQLQDMSKDQKQQMMKAMSPSEQDAFISKVRNLHAMGVGQ